MTHLFRDADMEDICGSAVFLDLDGTIVPDKEKDIQKAELDKIKKLSSRNEVYFCSNGSPMNAKRFAEEHGGKSLLCKKPFPGAFKGIVKSIGAEKAVVVGDKFLTDGLLARFLKTRFIKIEHLRGPNDSVFTRFSYILDDLAYFLMPYFELIRPWQWVKNLLVFAPLFFAGSAAFKADFMPVSGAFGAFCVAASIVYILNDIFDRFADRLHPKKKDRPLASGRATLRGAYFLLVLLAALEAGLLLIEPVLAPIIIFYIVLNMAYSTRLKHIAVIDILCVAFFYMMRIIAGGISSGIPLSAWIILCTFFGALFVIVGKRRSEYGNDSRRKVLEEYSRTALDFMLGASASLAIIAYGIWSVLAHDSPYLVYSTILVVLALFRMINRIHTNENEAEAPEVLVFKDKWILSSFLMWALYIFIIFY